MKRYVCPADVIVRVFVALIGIVALSSLVQLVIQIFIHFWR